MTALRGTPPGANAEAVPAALLADVCRDNAALIAGIAGYRRHPWRRELADPPAVWEEGGSRLLDYGAASDPGSPTVLFVPSLINRSYVLDLAPGRSMLRWLADRGARPLLLDWGWPGPEERRFTLTDYVAGRLERALREAVRLAGGPVVVAGYCMGGTLTVAAVQRRPDLVRGLALLAAPWDFHADDAALARQAAAYVPLLEPAFAFNGTLPVDLIQTMFTMLDPSGVAEKYRAFSRLDPTSARAELFVALEDWLADGVPLAAPVARACLSEWYGENAPARGTWCVAGVATDPAQIRVPTWVAIPRRDRIVPPGAARALAQAIGSAVVHEPAAGHIGMVAGSRAETALWEPFAHWLREVV